jgi:hypothetical protein
VSVLSVCPSIHMYQLSNCWTSFVEVLCWKFLKSCRAILIFINIKVYEISSFYSSEMKMKVFWDIAYCLHPDDG